MCHFYLRFLYYEFDPPHQSVKLAERSKAPDLSSGTRKCAWVRTPHLTKMTFFAYLINQSVNCVFYRNLRIWQQKIEFWMINYEKYLTDIGIDWCGLVSDSTSMSVGMYLEFVYIHSSIGIHHTLYKCFSSFTKTHTKSNAWR